MARRPRDVSQLLATLAEGGHRQRLEALRELCPCRQSSVRELTVWREIFRIARDGGLRERDQAAHAIGTLTGKAQQSERWHSLLQRLKAPLDELMRDPRSARLVLGEVGPGGCNTHAHRGAARQAYRRRRRALDLKTPGELAAWLNDHLHLAGRCAVQPNDLGIRRLWRWLEHRVRFQPARGTSEGELAAKARRFLPRLFEAELPGRA